MTKTNIKLLISNALKKNYWKMERLKRKQRKSANNYTKRKVALAFSFVIVSMIGCMEKEKKR